MPAVPGPAAVRGDNPASALPHTQKVKILLLCGQKKGNLSQYGCTKPSQLLQLWRGGVRVCARFCRFFQLDAWTQVAWPSSVVYCSQSTQHRGTCTIAFPRPQRTRVRRAQVGRDPRGPWSPAPGSTWDHSGTPASVAQALPELHPASMVPQPMRTQRSSAALRLPPAQLLHAPYPGRMRNPAAHGMHPVPFDSWRGKTQHDRAPACDRGQRLREEN